MHVPFIDLKAQYRSIQSQIDDRIKRTVSKFNFIRGSEVDEFEGSFKEKIGSKHCLATGNCTEALFIALKSLGIGPGDEVITPAFSWISSSETISLCNATPVFIDVHPLTYTLDPDKLEEKITEKTRAVIAVHLYGQAAHSGVLKELCNKHGLYLIEDCAQAHFTKEEGKYAGTYGDVGVFSFYPTKNLGAYGDAGCLVCDDTILFEHMKRFANHGALAKDDHEIEGFNSRMDSLQATVLMTKLPHIDEWNAKRRLNAELYNELLKNIPEIVTPNKRLAVEHTFHLYVIRCERRNQLKQFLEKQDIKTMIHYPCALPFLPAYAYMNHALDNFPVAAALQDDVLSLPIYPELTQEQIEFVCSSIKAFYRH